MLFESDLSLVDDTMITGIPEINEEHQLEQILKFIANLKLLPLEIDKISTEIKQLSLEVNDFKSGLANDQAYWQLLDFGVQLILNSSSEDDILKELVPIWSQQRGVVFDKDKLIDEFYRELEYYTLWSLLMQSATQQSFTPLVVSKMRAIIRRYSNMPALWYFLCQISGEELKTGYTF